MYEKKCKRKEQNVNVFVRKMSQQQNWFLWWFALFVFRGVLTRKSSFRQLFHRQKTKEREKDEQERAILVDDKLTRSHGQPKVKCPKYSAR
jgi:hypothetical protein